MSKKNYPKYGILIFLGTVPQGVDRHKKMLSLMKRFIGTILKYDILYMPIF